MNEFQERLQELLYEKDLNRLQLSKEVGISFETINGYFNKNLYPNLTVALKLSNFFGCSLHYLLGLTDEYTNNDTNNLSFIDTLKTLMQENNLSIETLMKNLNMSEANYYRWKNNKSTPSMQSLIAIAKYFDVSIDYLVYSYKLR